ncbi:MAG TPA: FG-GAP-like repeat-containing protein [Pyrinomonadaceae bacterium]|nr:FG-GAP-like repeat-containing protein [Pyrinomonadaceae bacterium]
MSWTLIRESSRTILFFAAVTFVVGAAFLFGLQPSPVEANDEKTVAASTLGGTTFPANAGTLGSIPDGTTCYTPGAPRDVTFTVSGMSGSPTDVELNVTGNHTWVGDMAVTLIAPNGTSHVIFARTEASSTSCFGDSSDFAGPYLFTDAATGVNWWDAAFAATGTQPVPAGSYRTTAAGPNNTPPAPVTNMNAAFAGVPDANGTWTLRVTDGASGDTGAITAASLTLSTAGGGAPADAPVDFNGDGRTDWAVIRNVGGSPSGQARWFYSLNTVGGFVAVDWGLANDFFVPADYDGDGKDDIAVWRPGAPGDAAFYIFNSATSTIRIEAFGQTGDDPTVVGDYNNDGTDDLAVYRPGSPSYWFYRTTPGGGVFYTAWGGPNDYPAPGDYNGDGRYDFVVQRADAGAGYFWILYNGPGTTSTVRFGFANDVIVPGDYDGGGSTDIAIVRGGGSGEIQWWIRSSETGNVVSFPFGLAAGDVPVQGDYDGDGWTDAAVWRNGTFWVLSSQTLGVQTFDLGAAGDYPVANYNTH